MKREDLRSRIIPTTIDNTDESQKTENKEFNTTDLIYLDSFEEQHDGEKRERKISATDYAKMNNAFTESAPMNCVVFYNPITRTGKQATKVWLRSAYSSYKVDYVHNDGDFHTMYTRIMGAGLCPSLHYHLPSDISARSVLRFLKRKKYIDESKELEQFDIRKVKNTTGEIIYHTLQIGEYPKTKVDENLSKILENLYNYGNLKNELVCTGRWYSGNGQKENYKDYAGKHSPEFEYQGQRYVRVVSYQENEKGRYSDGTLSGKVGTIRWVKVEPISFVIKNWDEMPKSINPKGNGRAKYFDLRAEEAITSNIPFYPDEDDQNSTMWQNSSIRGFFNGIDVRNIQSNGNIKFGANRGGNFTGECNFLNEAFYLSREPMIEYTIPDSETEIPDDAFNGCITLKKLVIHSGIKSIGKRAFDGLQFNYAYRTETGKLVLAQDLPRNENEYTEVVELGKISKSLDGFDYGILLQGDRLDEITVFSEILSKNNFCIPYVYGLALVEREKTKLLTENSDFRFFKNEVPGINDLLLNYPEEERLDFFKFARSLGCFSAEKILDRKGKETEVSLAQKASSLLAIILKTDGMKLR